MTSVYGKIELDDRFDDGSLSVGRHDVPDSRPWSAEPPRKFEAASAPPVIDDSHARGSLSTIGDRIGRYELEDRLGQGTFGTVLTARDTELDRRVALKVLKPSHYSDDAIVQRFLQEARAAARIEHPGIVTVFDCGRAGSEHDEVVYIAMERLRGESLLARLGRSGRLTSEMTAEIGRQVASALQAAHDAGVLHRDLKPDNIFLVPDPAVPAGERVKVLDFGLAKLGPGNQTQMQAVFGTPRYMSPEQCRSAALIDGRSDIYALGCVLFELVTGRAPFEGELYKVIESHLHVPPPRARSLVPEVSPVLDAILHRMLAKDARERFESMADVEEALRAAGAMAVGPAVTILPQEFKRVVGSLAPALQRADTRIASEPSVILRDSVEPVVVPGPTTHHPTPTFVTIRPLQRQPSWAAPIAAAVVLAILVGILIALLLT
ncbi:MAG TPA: serine/threonine-protein kinase [Kofleriaceae bacterium]|nr:serine/threonine-protein kinase [Kofleriaceae bacterium]